MQCSEDRQTFKTRPDTRPSVADGWAGAEVRVFPLFDYHYGPTDGWTDGWTDKASYTVSVHN